MKIEMTPNEKELGSKLTRIDDNGWWTYETEYGPQEIHADALMQMTMNRLCGGKI